MRRLLSTFGLALLAMGRATTPGVAQEPSILVVTSAGRCLVAVADREAAEVRTGDCAGAAPLRLVGGTVRTTSGLCLDWTNHGGPVHLSECRPRRGTQQWRFGANGLIRNGAQPHLCMDVEGGRSEEGTRILAWACQDLVRPHPNQRFQRAAPPAAPSGSVADSPTDDAGSTGNR